MKEVVPEFRRRMLAETVPASGIPRWQPGRDANISLCTSIRDLVRYRRLMVGAESVRHRFSGSRAVARSHSGTERRPIIRSIIGSQAVSLREANVMLVDGIDSQDGPHIVHAMRVDPAMPTLMAVSTIIRRSAELRLLPALRSPV
jgi:hypothetical protein